MQLGFMACNRGSPSLGICIFAGIAAVRPNSELPLIGLAYAHANAGKLSEAREILTKRAAVINPKNQLTKAILAMIFRISGEVNESDSLIDEVIEDGSDPQAVALAEQLKTEDFKYLRKKIGRLS
ncbi:MAG: hypothetical protein LBI69_01360 [Puniceicoccales bacterium]|nr:hypothetical protein [Puniceicoccales bacterium]